MFRSIFYGDAKSDHLKLAALVALFLLFSPVSWAEEPDLQKPGDYTGNEDVSGWVVSEKLDGIRGYWDGKHLLTRKGLQINPPPWFTRNFPPFELDGELWSGRGEYEFIQSVVLDKTPGDGWEKITYNIFEVPNQKGDFFSRLKKAEEWFVAHPDPVVRIIPQILIRERSDLDRIFREVESKGGEGVVVRDPKPEYHTGRSASILKVKQAHDMEAKVIAVNPGKGKYADAMGSLTVELENGVRFRLGTGFTDQVRHHPPLKGSIVTFRYHGFTKNGIPKFASFMRVRSD